MASDISPENEQFLEQAIVSGAFRSRNEAINAGVDLLKQRHELIDRLRASRLQLDNGEAVEFDDDGFQDLFNSLRERAREHSAKRHGC